MATKIPGLPTPAYPLVDPATGRINPVWFQFFNSLLQALSSNPQFGDVSVTSLTSSGLISAPNASFSKGIQFGEYFVATFPQTGYITINDSKGTPRRLMVG